MSAKGAREAQALLTEVEMGRTVLVREEAEWVKAAERVTELENAVTEADAKIAALREEQAPTRDELAAEEAKLSEARGEALEARNAAAREVDREIRQRYERLRSARSAAVVVALRGDACGACFTAVPRNRRSQIRAGLLLDNCEACGVLLYAEVEESV
ncbi:MAG: zinc ribbon domain-containing protein [Gemmatimonadales bacterium]